MDLPHPPADAGEPADKRPATAGRSATGCSARAATLAAGFCILTSALSPAAQWTVGVYMCADNGMNDLAYQDLAEMQGIGSTSEVNIVVQVDNAARDSNPTCRRYYIRKDGRTLLSDLGEVDMADTAVLIGFCRFLAEKYRAENYLLILWDHGNGWYPGEVRTNSIFIDESHGAHVMDVASGLGVALARARQKFGRGIRVVAFDACLMQMLEVAEELRPSCDYLLGSEGLVPATGFPYAEFLGLIVARPTGTPREFLLQMCDAYLAEYPGRDACLSAVDLRQLDRVVPVLAATLGDSVDPADPGFRDARREAQTFGFSEMRPPGPTDDHVDLLDFWSRAPAAGTGALRQTLGPLVVANKAQGEYAGAKGLAGWFPDRYLEFKYWLKSYQELALADTVPWPQFLNCWYGTDDIKPAQPLIRGHRLGGRGDVRLYWSGCPDLAPVSYDAYEATGPAEAFRDYCDSTGRWSAIGWTAQTGRAHSPAGAFFSGTGANLDHQLVQAQAMVLPEGGLLSFYAWHQTEESQDSSGIRRDACYVEWSHDKLNWTALDSLYGARPEWCEYRYVLPRGNNLWLRFRYRTDAVNHGAGVYLDDIQVQSFTGLRLVAEAAAETTCYIFNLARETTGYRYFVVARDSFGNRSMASHLYDIPVRTYAEPFTRPAPFAGACELVIDYPVGTRATVRVHTLSGTLVREWTGVEGRVILWDGGNQHFRPLADGLYIVTVEAPGFRKLGRIAKVARAPELR